jgi:hypothetical protein
MKKLSEKEILQHLQRRREKSEVTYQEVTNPAYEVFGRAREWPYNQCVCLLAGLIPITKSHFDLLLSERSPLALINVYLYYPIQNTDLNRLQNIDRLLEGFPSIIQAKKNNQTIPPKELLALCKKHPDITPFLPPKLIEIVESFGPHPSLNLPSVFSSLEINPSALANFKKFKERENKPISYNSIAQDNILPQKLPIPPIPTESPLAIAKRLFPLQDVNYWAKVDILSATEILLLYYEVDPSICRVHPSEISENAPSKELCQYLNRYFHGDQQWFLNQLDQNNLRTLLQRSIDAGAIHSVRGNKFSTIDIIKWMQSKNLRFPLVDDSQDGFQSKLSIDEICAIDFTSYTPDQNFRLMARILATAIWKQGRSKSLKEVVHDEASTTLRKLWAKVHDTDACAPRTYEAYIREVNPNYKPRK